MHKLMCPNCETPVTEIPCDILGLNILATCQKCKWKATTEWAAVNCEKRPVLSEQTKLEL